MMNHKRILSFLLALVLILGMLPPASASAIGEIKCSTCGETDCPGHEEAEEAAPQNEDSDVQPCPDCGNDISDGKPHASSCPTLCTCSPVDGAHDITCVLNPEYMAPVPCEICGTVNCTTEHVYCETCAKYDCGIDHSLPVPCMICGTENCTANHVKCEICDKYDCGIDHSAAETDEPLCDKCNASKDEAGNVIHEETCLTLCTCTPVDGVHQEGCKLYVAPVETCEYCGVELIEGAVHEEDCMTNCTCEPVDGVHQEGCKLYRESSEFDVALNALVDAVNALPEAEAVKAFAEAVDEYAIAHARTNLDEPLPDGAESAYVSAHNAFAEAMGYTESVTVEYPDSSLEQELVEAVMEAWYLSYDLEDAYSEELAEIEDLEENEDHPYILAMAKLNAVTEAYPELFESQVAMFAAGDSNLLVDDSKIANDKIEINLFNYGSSINTRLNGMGFLRFHNSTSYWGEFADGTEGTSNGTAPLLNAKLTNGFPVIQNMSGMTGYNETTGPFSGSLSYLFSNSARTTEAYTINANGSEGGTGLFQLKDGYYEYDSALNAASYNSETGKFDLYDVVLRPSHTEYDDDISNGNFLPFNPITSDTAREDYSTSAQLKANNNAGYSATVSTKPDASKVDAYRLYGTNSSNQTDLWFGMTVEFDFYMPEGGKVNGTDMVFEFLGDDDVWVFIDDVLVLDIGGTHAAKAGTINFATGVVTNPDVGHMQGTSTLSTLLKNAGVTTGLEGNTLQKYTKHNLKFFYMERGGNISYCKLRFNMDPVPTGGVSLRKEVVGFNSALSEDRSYTFTFNATNESPDQQAVINSGVSYVVTGSNGKETRTVKPNETFTLKAGENAVFTLPDDSVVTLTEITDAAITSATEWTLNGNQIQSPNNSVTCTVDKDSNQSFSYVCTNTRATTSLAVEKKMAGDEYATSDEYEMNVTIGGKPYTGSATKTAADGTTTSTVTFDANGKIKLLADEKVTITGIPTGLAYTVTETTPANTSVYSYDAPSYKVNEVSVETAGGNINVATNVTVTNTLHLLFGDLTITKTGIDSLDNHAASGKNKEEQQSTVYRIYGKSASGTTVDMEVVIVGNDTITVKNIPVGTYTVTEKVDWSWRYDNESSEKNAVITGGKTTPVAFANDRQRIYWLSGDNYLKNWFNGVTTTPTE